jgi:hypothetical protein
MKERTPMSVAAAFAAYLRDPASYGNLVHELDSAGLNGQAAFLRAFQADGAVSADGGELGPEWTGRRCALGIAPPQEAVDGDLWFDPVEVAVMILVPRPSRQYAAWPLPVQQRMTRFVSWLAIARTTAWQVRGWTDAASAEVEIPAELADTEPATGLSGWEANAYAAYFGKSLADAFDWQAVAAMGSEAARLWPDNSSELIGYVGEGEVSVLSKDRALSADEDDEEDANGEDNGFLADATPLPGVAFRTHISSQLGLLTDRSRWNRGR